MNIKRRNRMINNYLLFILINSILFYLQFNSSKKIKEKNK